MNYFTRVCDICLGDTGEKRIAKGCYFVDDGGTFEVSYDACATHLKEVKAQGFEIEEYTDHYLWRQI